MADVQVQLVVAAGLFSLGGVALGALLTPLTQLYLEKKREQRAADCAKLLVAGELLHAQLVLSATSELEHWPPVGRRRRCFLTDLCVAGESIQLGKQGT